MKSMERSPTPQAPCGGPEGAPLPSECVEIERKFLVAGDFRPFVSRSLTIRQGFLSSHPERVVRVRLSGEEGCLTVKGPSRDGGVSRFEWESALEVEEARRLLELCEPGMIEKTRHLVDAGAHLFEIDEFHGANEGLVVAEIELASPEEVFERPAWLGEEVTADPRYANAALARCPYSMWRTAGGQGVRMN